MPLCVSTDKKQFASKLQFERQGLLPQSLISGLPVASNFQCESACFQPMSLGSICPT